MEMGTAKQSTSIADLILHMDENLGARESHALEDHLRADTCVLSVGQGAGRGQMMMVAYDPECTTAGNILHRVTDMGLHARMIGL
jgi:hypothetical protein